MQLARSRSWFALLSFPLMAACGSTVSGTPVVDAGVGPVPEVDAAAPLAPSSSDVCVPRAPAEVRCVDVESGAVVDIAGTRGASVLDSVGARRCALRGDGAIACWSRGERAAVVLDAGARFVDIDVSSSRVCGATVDARVACFDEAGTIAWADVSDVLDVAIAGEALCVAYANGTAECFWENELDAYALPLAGVIQLDGHGGLLAAAALDGTVHVAPELDALRERGDEAMQRIDGVRGRALIATSAGACVIAEDGRTPCWSPAGLVQSTALDGARSLVATDPLVCALLDEATICVSAGEPGAVVWQGSAR